jgi:hypothetical protein
MSIKLSISRVLTTFTAMATSSWPLTTGTSSNVPGAEHRVYPNFSGQFQIPFFVFGTRTQVFAGPNGVGLTKMLTPHMIGQ